MTMYIQTDGLIASQYILDILSYINSLLTYNCTIKTKMIHLTNI